jgi:hypothetical protein
MVADMSTNRSAWRQRKRRAWRRMKMGLKLSPRSSSTRTQLARSSSRSSASRPRLVASDRQLRAMRWARAYSSPPTSRSRSASRSRWRASSPAVSAALAAHSLQSRSRTGRWEARRLTETGSYVSGWRRRLSRSWAAACRARTRLRLAVTVSRTVPPLAAVRDPHRRLREVSAGDLPPRKPEQKPDTDSETGGTGWRARGRRSRSQPGVASSACWQRQEIGRDGR